MFASTGIAGRKKDPPVSYSFCFTFDNNGLSRKEVVYIYIYIYIYKECVWEREG